MKIDLCLIIVAKYQYPKPPLVVEQILNTAKSSLMSSSTLCKLYDAINIISSQIMVRVLEITDCVAVCEFWWKKDDWR